MTPPDTMRDRFYRVAADLLDANPRLAVVLADIGVGQMQATGAIDRHPRRIVNVGIREQLMVTTAAGMALEGMRPIVHTYAPFLVERSFEQVKLDFAHQGVGGILVSVGASYDWAQGGRTHQSPGDIALMATLPGWAIHVPGHAAEMEHLLRRAVSENGPVYLRLAEQQNNEPRRDGCEGIALVRQGLHGGPTILAVGPMLDRVLEAAVGLDATILYTATVRPLDVEVLRHHVTGADVGVVEPYQEGTSAAAITAALAGRAIRLLCIGVPNIEHRRYGSHHDHDRAHGLDAAGIRARLTAGWLFRSAAPSGRR